MKDNITKSKRNDKPILEKLLRESFEDKKLATNIHSSFQVIYNISKNS